MSIRKSFYKKMFQSPNKRKVRQTYVLSPLGGLILSALCETAADFLRKFPRWGNHAHRLLDDLSKIQILIKIRAPQQKQIEFQLSNIFRSKVGLNHL